jgi:hypothetical protein
VIPEAELERRLREDPTGDPLYGFRFSTRAVAGDLARRRDDRRLSGRTRFVGRGVRPASLLIAIALLILLALAIAQVGRRPVPAPIATAAPVPSATAAQVPDLFGQIEVSGVVRIAVRPEQLEFRLPGSKGSFDEDVATEIAKRFKVRLELIRLSTAEMLAEGSGATWDVALPSVADWLIPATRFAMSQPYYYWPHFLVGPLGLRDQTIAAGPICAVENDQGAEWLRGTYGDATTPPITTNIIERANDKDCLAAVQAGDAVAFVTAGLTYVDSGCLYSGCTNGSIPGGQGIDKAEVVGWRSSPVEPRSAIVHQGGSAPETLIQALDTVFEGMRDDGRIVAITNAHFGPGREVGYETGSAP